MLDMFRASEISLSYDAVDCRICQRILGAGSWQNDQQRVEEMLE